MKALLDSIEEIQGIKVTDEHREAALEVTKCQALDCMDEAQSCVCGDVRRYGGTLVAQLASFAEAREVIQEEMERILLRNLEAVVTGNKAARRILNFEMAVAEKEARDVPETVTPEVESEESESEDPDFVE